MTAKNKDKGEKTAGPSSARSGLARDDNERQERANAIPDSRSLKTSAQCAVRDDNVKNRAKERAKGRNAEGRLRALPFLC
jgi:hypothetical protein